MMGICGTFMGGLALLAKQSGAMVSGSDQNVYPPMSTQLAEQGIQLAEGYLATQLDETVDCVVVGNVIRRGNPLIESIMKSKVPWISGPAWLYDTILKHRHVLAVAGTHGKTTTTSMLAWILEFAGLSPSFLIGGVPENFSVSARLTDSPFFVIEADEYDRSFLKLSPDIAVITAMDADHLDIYGTKENMEDAFVEFANLVKPRGVLFTKYGLPEKNFSASNHQRYSLQNDMADIYGANITMRDGGYVFDVKSGKWELNEVKLNMGGMYNVENAVAAVAIAIQLGISPIKIKNAIGTFKGVKRRFEYIIPVSEASKLANNVVYIDDYAHHPEELGALIKSVKSLFSFKKCTVIFQPHLFSRTKDLAKEFAESLDMADRILLLPIYPARELPIEGVSSKMILDKMENKNGAVVSKEELLNYLQGDYLKLVKESSSGEVLVTAGAGDIDKLVEPIKKIILNS